MAPLLQPQTHLYRKMRVLSIGLSGLFVSNRHGTRQGSWGDAWVLTNLLLIVSLKQCIRTPNNLPGTWALSGPLQRGTLDSGSGREFHSGLVEIYVT